MTRDLEKFTLKSISLKDLYGDVHQTKASKSFTQFSLTYPIGYKAKVIAFTGL